MKHRRGWRNGALEIPLEIRVASRLELSFGRGRNGRMIIACVTLPQVLVESD